MFSSNVAYYTGERERERERERVVYGCVSDVAQQDPPFVHLL
jgi:hypothetical protein